MLIVQDQELAGRMWLWLLCGGMDASATASAIAAIASAVAAILSLKVSRRSLRVPIEAEELAARLQQAAADQALKLDCFRRIMGYRFMLTGSEMMTALNEVAVVFNDKPDVVLALRVFHQTVIAHDGRANERLLSLIQEMARSLGINTQHLDQNLILQPFGA